jgi:Uma2 family endonuclease
MNAIALPQLISVEEYLSGEQLSDVKHEYVGGYVYAMAGASRSHNRVAGNLFASLLAQLKGKPCQPFIGDMKVRLMIAQEDRFYYPDVVVGCDPRDTDDYYLRFPRLVIEVLSESTERVDREEKFHNYQTIPSLEEYMLVAQDKWEVTLFRRANGWLGELYQGRETSIYLASVGCTISLEEIYAEVPGLS